MFEISADHIYPGVCPELEQSNGKTVAYADPCAAVALIRRIPESIAGATIHL